MKRQLEWNELMAMPVKERMTAMMVEAGSDRRYYGLLGAVTGDADFKRQATWAAAQLEALWCACTAIGCTTAETDAAYERSRELGSVRAAAGCPRGKELAMAFAIAGLAVEDVTPATDETSASSEKREPKAVQA